MSEASITSIEDEVAAHLARGAIDDATSLVLRTFGGELLSFLHGIAPRGDQADEAFSVLSVAVWRSLSSFERRSSLRTWLYVLARRAVSRVLRGAKPEEIPLSSASVVSLLVAEVRTTSLPHLAPVRDQFAALRAQLDTDDQMLLVLRVDRELPWRDVAEVMADEGADLDRVAAALRKRFERVKEQIRTLAREAGLVL